MKWGIVGAGGAVGRELLALAAKAGIEPPSVFGTPRSRGATLAYGERSLRSEVLWDEPVMPYDFLFFSTEADVSEEWISQYRKAGATICDLSSAFRNDPAVPLVVPEINGDLIDAGTTLFANPNCTAAILCVALAPLVPLGIERVTVSTYQAVSGAGRAGLEALEREERGESSMKNDPFPFPIHRNLFPVVGDIGEDGESGEEEKVRRETRRILDLPDLDLAVTCVRVPIERCHSEAVTIDFAGPVSRAAVLERFESVPHIDLPAEAPTPLSRRERSGVAVGRVRAAGPNRVQLWVVGDQLLQGAAENAFRIFERWMDRRADGA